MTMQVLEVLPSTKNERGQAPLNVQALVQVGRETFIGVFRRNGSPIPQEKDLISLEKPSRQESPPTVA